uniref:Bestrophin homolog n=1 Tax=Syphacia muris TaxID=451379 RepID=A0A0N5AAH1_9BILA
MTISYQLDISRASVLSFLRLLFRWKGSLWKNVLKELFIWSIAYFVISFCYRAPFIMSEDAKLHLTFIPLTFILGFYVSTIVSRWTVVFQNMGYIESQALFVSSYVQGDDDETRLQRRAMVRYMCLSQALVFRDICVPVRKRFPTYDSLVKAGLHEKEKLLGYRLNYDKYWVPINWSYSLFFEARRAGKITSDVMTNKMCDELKVFRTNLQMLCNYDWVPLPLVYPQVIMIAVYFYFFICLFSRQYILTSTIDIVVPVMTMIQFVFYVGWMKAAEVLLNPMGEDDDDFECNYLLDKNLATSLCIVDECRADAPPVETDQFWGSGQVEQIYSEAAAAEQQHPLVGSAVHAKFVTVYTLTNVPECSTSFLEEDDTTEKLADAASGGDVTDVKPIPKSSSSKFLQRQSSVSDNLPLIPKLLNSLFSIN